MRKSTCLATALLASCFVVSRATAGPTIVLSSPLDLTKITVGEHVPIDVSLQGLAVGTDFIFNLNTRVLFDGALFQPLPDPATTSGLTPGTIFIIPSQISNFDAVSSLNTASATGVFSDQAPSSSAAINQNGLYYSFMLQATAAGSGSIQFDPAFTIYAADDTGFNYAPLPTGGPLSVSVSASNVPEPSAYAVLAAAGLSSIGLLARRRRR